MKNVRNLAGCVIYNSAGEVLLLHRNTSKLTQWELPGGKLENGESSRDAARREVREELGVEVDLIRWIGSGTFRDDGYDWKYDWHEAHIIDGTPGIEERDKFDGLAYHPILTEGFDTREFSINIVNLIRHLHNGSDNR